MLAFAEVTWPPLAVYTTPCVFGYSVIASSRQRIVVASAYDDKQLHVHDLVSGSRLRVVGRRGSGRGEFAFGWGGMCFTPRGTVLVAEYYNDRVQEVRVDAGVGTRDGDVVSSSNSDDDDDDVAACHVRFLCQRPRFGPQYIDCNDDVVVVAEVSNCISVFSLRDGAPRGRLAASRRGVIPTVTETLTR